MPGTALGDLHVLTNFFFTTVLRGWHFNREDGKVHTG